MKGRDEKVHGSTEKASKLFPPALLLLSLCGFSFYLGGMFCSEKDATTDQYNGIEVDKKFANCQSHVKPLANFKDCNISLQDLTPCTDPHRWCKYDKYQLAFRELHCPSPSERMECLIPSPEGYTTPIRWPHSRDECCIGPLRRFAFLKLKTLPIEYRCAGRNVPHDWINTAKENQRWMQKKGDKFIFPGGGTTFPNGVDDYLDQMQELIPGMKDGTIRAALDTGCGVASWGGYLLHRGILTMSVAPRDNHGAQVQFALERGVHAMIGVISTQRLPYPANAFDMAHC